MAYRTFVDSAGVAWQVWEVRPTTVERRAVERRIGSGEYRGIERRTGVDRRTRSEQRVSLGPLSHGWLAFHSAGEKRRYAPIPEGWSKLTTLELAELCEKAKPVVHYTPSNGGGKPEGKLPGDAASGLRKLSA